MATKKSINAALPSFGSLRRNYMAHGTTGFMDGREYLDEAFANLDGEGECESITIYSGPGREPRHYYGDDSTVEITEILLDVLDPEQSAYREPNGLYQIDPRHFRAWIISRIQAAISEATGQDETENQRAPIGDLIPLAEYAAAHGLIENTVRRKCIRGNVPGAVKIGRDWFIPSDAEYTDCRIKSGAYVDARKRKTGKIAG